MFGVEVWRCDLALVLYWEEFGLVKVLIAGASRAERMDLDIESCLVLDDQKTDDGRRTNHIDIDINIVDDTAPGIGVGTSRIAASWRYRGCGIGVGKRQKRSQPCRSLVRYLYHAVHYRTTACAFHCSSSPQFGLSHRPPCIANDDSISTSALMMPHDNGIHVDIRKKPDVYTPLSL